MMMKIEYSVIIAINLSLKDIIKIALNLEVILTIFMKGND